MANTKRKKKTNNKKRTLKKKKLNLTKLIVIIISLIILGTIGQQVFIRHFFNQRDTVVPNVINLSSEEAVKYLEAANLNYNIIESKNDDVSIGHVYNQFPEAGKVVKVNRTINIWINSDQGKVVPSIVGLELLEARYILQQLNIEIEKIDYQPSTERYNTVISVYPSVGSQLASNQKISLLVSSQQTSDPNYMPNLIGLNLQDAREMLNQLNLNLGDITYGSDPSLPQNTVINTRPSAGSRLSPKQMISLVINRVETPTNNEQSIEDIIIETNKEIENRDLENKEIENIINDTLEKIKKDEENGNGNKGSSE